MEPDFSGKVAIVTGGGSGIGAAVVRRLAGRGCAVLIADILEKGSQLSNELKLGGARVEYLCVDVKKAEDANFAITRAESEFGGLDILVNCAGIFPRATLAETDEELWNQIMDVNLKGSFLFCQAAAPALIRRGGGSIVNIGSMNAYGGPPNLTAYSISKGGLLTLNRNLAKSLAIHRIRVNCVTPGWVISEGEIEMQRNLGKSADWLKTMGERMPLGRLQTPDDIAISVLFLASNLASQITGQNLGVDGGMSLSCEGIKQFSG